MPPKVSLLKLTQTEATKRLYDNNHMIQDMLVPIETLADSIRLMKEAVNIFPIWLCPFTLPPNPGMVHPIDMNSSQMYVDIGLYGVPHVDDFRPRETTRLIEKFVMDVHG